MEQMMNNLQPLKWKDLSQGEVRCVRADSPMYDYAIVNDGKAFKVGYYNLQSPIKYATGFATIDEAKEWAWNHYNEKMQPYVKPSPTWISVKDKLPNVDRDTQFICSYDSAIDTFSKVAWFNANIGKFDYQHDDVLAWMPIPEFSEVTK